MRLITRGYKAIGVAEHWKQTYNDRNGNWRYGDNKRVTYEKLAALGPEPHPDDVDKIIGNTSWTACHCDECRDSVEYVVMVGQEPDYDSATAHLCRDCIEKAWRIVE